MYKAQEFRNQILFFFPLILDCIGQNHKERNLWLQLAYCIRACIIPDEEFSQINPTTISQTMTQFYKTYALLFGAINCTYTVHVVCSHLLQMRTLGPLTETSAFCFENFYSKLRQSFVPGTSTPLKQMLQNVILKRSLSSHNCNKNIYYSANDTPIESNSYIYCYNDNTHHMYKIISVHESHVTCYQQGFQPISFPETPRIEWKKVGVFKQGPMGNSKISVQLSDISGKVILVRNLFITCPNNVLQEQ